MLISFRKSAFNRMFLLLVHYFTWFYRISCEKHYFCLMHEEKEILKKILLPIDSFWEIEKVEVNESAKSIFVDLRYNSTEIIEDGISHKVFDYRSSRVWRHLDLWEYKTYLRARLPRYRYEDKVKTASVPWAESIERMTYLLEKKR